LPFDFAVSFTLFFGWFNSCSGMDFLIRVVLCAVYFQVKHLTPLADQVLADPTTTTRQAGVLGFVLLQLFLNIDFQWCHHNNTTGDSCIVTSYLNRMVYLHAVVLVAFVHAIATPKKRSDASCCRRLSVATKRCRSLMVLMLTFLQLGIWYSPANQLQRCSGTGFAAITALVAAVLALWPPL
jgi:uncharacterized membrane protein YiaA